MINTPNKYNKNNNSKTATATATAATATTTNERHSQKIPLPLPLSLPLHLLPCTPPPQLTSPHLTPHTPHTPLEVSKTSSQSRCIWATQSQNGDLELKKAVVQQSTYEVIDYMNTL